jgi:hypothetical protein
MERSVEKHPCHRNRHSVGMTPERVWAHFYRNVLRREHCPFLPSDSFLRNERRKHPATPRTQTSPPTPLQRRGEQGHDVRRKPPLSFGEGSGVRSGSEVLQVACVFHSVRNESLGRNGQCPCATHSVRNVSTNILEAFLRNAGFGGRDAFLPSVPSLTGWRWRVENCCLRQASPAGTCTASANSEFKFFPQVLVATKS